jgi:flagellar basal-body rod modification protein FlgD
MTAVASVNPTNTTTGSTNAQSPSAATGAGGLGSLTASDFLQLLIAQVENQSPLNPVSSSQFMAQTAELSTLEQTAKLSEETATLLDTQQFSAGLSAMGKTVTGIDTTGNSVTGKVTSVTLGTSGPVLHIANSLVPLSSVSSAT